MLVGIKERFAIEAEPDSFIDGWILGRFRFWIGGCEVGNWNDIADLKGCYAWLRDFEQIPRKRYEPSLSDLSAQEVFRKVFDPVMPGGISHPDELPITNSYHRFHISHLGMSSFERFDILLLTDEHGAEWCMWRRVGIPSIAECRLRPGEMESVAKAFCDLFEAKYLANAN
jgi:hypothetical protein